MKKTKKTKRIIKSRKIRITKKITRPSRVSQNPRALISVANKEGIVDFARELKNLGYDLIATGGTQKLLTEHGVKAIKISDYTGGTESERVKTLSQRVAKEILETGEISLVICNLYPFADQENKTLDEMIEFIDIGGVTLIRAAAKNYKKVAPIYDAKQYPDVICAIKEKRFDEEFRLNLCRKALDYIAWYDAVIADYFNQRTPDRYYFSLGTEKFIPMRYGENPHQQAAFYLDRKKQKLFKQLGGKELSYNNILDTDAAFRLAHEFEPITCAIIKHANPCGVAHGENLKEAFKRAFLADSISAFGGIVAFNRLVDAATAQEIGKSFFEVIVAPDFETEALKILAAKKNLRLVRLDPKIFSNRVFRNALGGHLVQDEDLSDYAEWKVVTKRAPDEYEKETLKFAWKVCKWVKSNAIVLAIKGRTVGIGAGQPNRVGSVEIAVKKMGAKPIGVVMASDGFFPFRDAVDAASQSGITAIIQPGGSIRDQEAIDACNEKDIAMVFTGYRHFRH